jgi:hypothetical protein
MIENFKVAVNKKPDVTDLVGERVMIDFESGKYFILTGTANDIWDMLENGVESEGIVKSLLEIYEVEADTCRQGVLSFLNDLAQIGFVSLEKC